MFHSQSNPINGNSDLFLLYQLDWENNETTLLDVNGILRDGLGPARAPMSHLVRVVQSLAQQQKKGTMRFCVDVDFDETSIALRLRQNICSCRVAGVSRSQMAQLLGGILSPRELEIAMEMFEGRTIRYIAQHLQIAEGTVKRTMHNIYCKLGIASQVDLVREIYARACQQPED